jgi:cytosine/adenosine deaminase-related metal-dependent hydrolase
VDDFLLYTGMNHPSPLLAALLAAALAAAFALGNASAQTAPSRFALRGTVVTPDGALPNATVLVSGGMIEAVGSLRLDPGVPVVETGGIIFPGLIDLHNHLTWNVFPRWSSGLRFPNRYEWQQLPAYLAALANPHAKLIAEGMGPAMARYAEVKAIAGGATSLAGLYPEDLGPGFRPPYHGLMRHLDVGSGFYADGTRDPVRYEVFPLVLSEADAAEIRSGLQTRRIRSLLIHLAEGAPNDASSRMEYRILKARGLLLPGVTLIHGVALHAEQFAEMASLGVGLVWSPRSNIELYGATADVASAKRAGVRIALAPDWSPTGSDGMLEELHFAADLEASLASPVFSPDELVRMATGVPAGLAGVDTRVGAIRPGLCADLLVIRQTGSPAESALVHAGAPDVLMVMVGGRPVYGQKELVESLAPGAGWAAVSVKGASKEVSLPADPGLGDWQSLTGRLDAAMRPLGTRLGPLVSE